MEISRIKSRQGFLWRLPACLGLILALLSATPPALSAAETSNVQESILPNGARLIQQRATETGQASIVAIMLVGTAQQTEQEAHVAHIAEHMVFQNPLPGKPSLTEQVMAWGGSLNGHTALEHTALGLTVPEEHLAAASEAFIQAIFHNEYDPGVYARELNGYMRIELIRHPARYPAGPIVAFQRQVFENSDYAEDIFGHDVTQVKAETVADWHRRHYAPNRLILAVSSNLPHQQVRSALESSLALAPTLPSVVEPPRQLRPPEQGEIKLRHQPHKTIMIGLAIDQVEPADRTRLYQLLRLLQARMLWSNVPLRYLPELSQQSWQHDSVYLQLGFVEPVPPSPRQTATGLRSEFSQTARELCTSIRPADLRAFHSYQPHVDSSLARQQANVFAGLALAGQHLPFYVHPDARDLEQMDQDALADELLTTAKQYLPGARMLELTVTPLPSGQWGLLASAIGCLLLLFALLALAVRLLAKRCHQLHVLLSMAGISLKTMFRPDKRGENGSSRLALHLLSSLGVLFISLTLALILAEICITLGHPLLLFVTTIIALSAMLTITSGNLLLATLLQSNDSQRLGAMPISRASVVFVRLGMNALSQYPIVFLVLIPVTWRYADILSGGLPVWLMTCAVGLLLPIFALALVSIPVLFLMRFLSSQWRERLLLAWSMLLSLSLPLLQLANSGRVGTSSLASSLTKLIQQRQYDLPGMIGRAFPPAIWAGRAIMLAGTPAGFASFALLLLVALGLLWLVGKLSLYCYLTEPPSFRRRRSRTADSHSARIVSISPLRALWLREWRQFWRTPALLIATLPSALTPVLMLYPFMLRGIREQGMAVIAQAARLQYGQSLLPALLAAPIAMLVALGTRAPSIAVSWEGTSFYLSKSIPVDYRVQLQAKLLNSLAIGAICLLPAYLFCSFWLHFSFPLALAVLIMAVLGLFAGVLVALEEDVSTPSLSWENMQQLFSQKSGIVPVLIAAALFFGAMLLNKLVAGNGWQQWLAWAVIAALFGLFNFRSLRSLLQQADELYAKIEP